MVADTVLPYSPVELARKHREGLGCHDDVVGKRWYDSEGRKFCEKRRRNQRQCYKKRRKAEAKLKGEKKLEEEEKRKRNWRIDNRSRFN
jgi:hypothetical protein